MSEKKTCGMCLSFVPAFEIISGKFDGTCHSDATKPRPGNSQNDACDCFRPKKGKRS